MRYLPPRNQRQAVVSPVGPRDAGSYGQPAELRYSDESASLRWLDEAWVRTILV